MISLMGRYRCEVMLDCHGNYNSQLSMPSIWSIIYHDVTNENPAPQGRGEVDTRSCIVLLLDLFTQWFAGDQLSHVILTEVIKSVSYSVMSCDLCYDHVILLKLSRV